MFSKSQCATRAGCGSSGRESSCTCITNLSRGCGCQRWSTVWWPECPAALLRSNRGVLDRSNPRSWLKSQGATASGPFTACLWWPVPSAAAAAACSCRWLYAPLTRGRLPGHAFFHQLPYMNVHAWAVKQARLHVPPHARIPVSLLPAEQAVKLAAHPCCKLNECLHCVYKFGTPELGEQCPPRGVQMELLHWLHQKNSGRRCTQVAPEYWIAANRSGGCGSVNVLRCYGNVAFVAVATAATAAAGAAGAAC